MGCRLAKGNWSDILPLLEEFADKIYKNQGALTYLYKYSQNEVKSEDDLYPNLFDLNSLEGNIGNAC